MTDRSIRSFALDYYRKRGADVRPLEGDAETFEITAPEGKTLKVTFADEAPAQAGSGIATALTATSPQWRAILEDLTSDVAVSYRYLASAPIANPARTLGQALPAGWAIAAARLLSVENRVAVGYSHRVTFDSPALNARREVMHQHLWDVETGRRLLGLEPAMYEAPTLLIRPESFPSEATVKALLDRSLAIVDADTDARGAEIERELQVQLGEAETRTNQYYEQQMGHVLQREQLLVEKLDATIRRLTEAKTPDAIARYRQDGATLQGQLEHARQTREQTLGEIEAACTRKLLTERERHELTAMTDLVAVCHAAYDVLTYRVTATPPGGEAVEIEIRYWPASRELALPDCPTCGTTMDAPRPVAGGGVACADCVTACPGCGEAGAGAAVVGACTACQASVCGHCQTSCTQCEGSVCADHQAVCDACQAELCTRCTTECATCEAALCRAHAHVDPLTGTLHCKAHRPTEYLLNPPAIAPLAEPAAPAEEAASPLALPRDAAEGAPGTPSEVVAEPVPAPASAPLNPLVAFTAAALGLGAPNRDELRQAAEDVGAPEPAAFLARVTDESQQDAAIAALFGKPLPQVLNGLTGRAMPAVQADTCPSCSDHFAVAEMVDCPTCGVPACKRCTSGEMGPCPACESLAPTVASDPRLAPVLEAFPNLAGRRSWEVACVGPYVVTHWSRWGAWGMVVYHTGDDGRTPVVVTEFRYGRFAAVGQALGFRGRR